MNYTLVNNYSILISGPLFQLSVLQIPYYLSLGFEVVYSTYIPTNTYEESILELLKTKLHPDKIIVSDKPNTDYIDNKLNILFHSYCCLNGMKLVTRPVVIKIRSTYILYNLNPIINLFSSNPQSVISCSFGFAKSKYTLYHPADTIIIAKKEEMEYVWNKVYNNCKLNNYSKFHMDMVPEQKICLGFLEYRNILVTPDNFFNISECKTNIKQNYNVIDIDKLYPLLYSSSFQGLYNIQYQDNKHYNYFCKSIDEY